MSDGIQQLSTEAMIREEKRCNTSKVPEAYFSKVGGQPHLQDFNEYKQLYKESIDNPDKFWGRMCRELLTFDQDFTTVSKGTLAKGDVTWFSDGCLNATYNCVDRHAARTPEKPAIIFEADEPDAGRTVTYGDLLSSVCRLSLVLKEIGVKKGDIVSVYMPNIPEAIIAIFAISRIGAIHSLTFDGFSAKALSDRILDAGSKVVLTADQGQRGARAIEMKSVVDEALKVCPEVHTVLVYRHTGANVFWSQKRDIWWHEVIEKYPDFLEPEIMHSEDPLFVLYTSGSTGKPKGLVHSTAGFLVGAAATGKYVFDIHNDDVFFCGGDIGWITGLTYAVYAPLLLGCTTIVFEGSPLYPSITRYWDICDKHNVSQFYVAPTAIRLLKRVTGDHIRQSMKNLRILASVGEPIAPEVWNWYHRVVGKGNSHVLDTYFQTETGSLVLTPLAGITPTKPGSCALPFFGIEPVILDPISGVECQDHNVEGVLAFKQPWPSMARTAWGDHPKYMDTYFKPYEGYYFTADRAQRDVDGYYWIMGRADDVVNVAAHRVSTAEVEAALLTNPTVAEAAVVGIDDNITGQALVAFVSLKNDNVAGDLKRELMERVSNTIGSFARPRVVHIVNDLPKTRSGKITRRILRNILSNQLDRIGDTSTLVNPTAIDSIAKVVYGSL